MEALSVDPQHGLTVALALVAIGLALNFLKWLVELFSETFRKKSEQSDQALSATRDLSVRIAAMERDLNEILKFRQDFRRLFSAIKVLAGDKWPEIRKAVMEDDLQ